MNKKERKEYNRKYYIINKEKILKFAKARKEKNKKYLKIYYKDYCRKNRKELLKKKKVYAKENKEKILKYAIEYYNRNKIKILKQREGYSKKYWKLHKKKLKKQKKKYRQQHKKEIAKQCKIYIKKRRKEDPTFRLVESLRSRLRLALKGNPKASTTMKLVGCSIDQLKQRLESKFTKGMSWDNYGRKKGIKCWEIDHIKPCCSFDLSKPLEQKICFHYTNLQPLWAIDNIRKGKK